MIFEEKVKEPRLSDKIKDIINRSIDEKNSSPVDGILKSKSVIMKLLTNNQDLLRTLHNDDLAGNDEIINGDAYRDVCIFDFMKLPDDTHEVKNYVCFEINDTGYGDLVNRRVIFRTVSHESDHKTDWGFSRQDLLAFIVKNEFDWSNSIGTHLELESDIGAVTNDGYYYRELVYKSKAPNNTYNKINRRF